MKKLITAFLLLALYAQAAFSQSFDKSRYSVVLPTEQPDLFMVGVGGHPEQGDFQSVRWGYVNASGKVLLEPAYQQIGNFISGFAVVKQGGKYGFINENYKLVIPCNYTAVGSFNDKGLVWVNQGGKFDDVVAGQINGGYFGVFDTNGKEIVPVKFKAIGTFNHRRAKFGHPFVNFTVIPESIRDMERDAGVFDVHDYSYIDSRMNIPMSMTWDDNIVVSNTASRQKDGIYSSSGTVLMPPDKFDDIFAPSEGMIPVARQYSGSLQTNYYNISAGGLMFTNWVNVDCITPFCGGIAIMAVHGRNTFISKAGAKLGTPYDIILPSESDHYVVSQNSAYGVVKNDGTVIVPPSYFVILPMREGLMLSRRVKDGNIEYIDVNGKCLIKTEFESGTSFRHGCANVRKNGLWGVIGNDGRKIVSCRFFSIMPPTEENPKRIWVKMEKGGENFCVDTATDMVAFPASFRKVSNFNEHYSGVAFVGLNEGKYGCIDINGQFVIPTVMESIDQALSNYSAMCKDGKSRWTETDLWRWNLRKEEASKLHPVSSTVNEEEWDY